MDKTDKSGNPSSGTALRSQETGQCQLYHGAPCAGQQQDNPDGDGQGSSGFAVRCGLVQLWWLDLHVYTRRSLGISTGCSKKDLQAGDKEEKKKTTTTGQTWTMWTRTTLKMNVQWVLCCFWSRGREKKGGSSAQIQLYIVQVPRYGQAGQATLLLSWSWSWCLLWAGSGQIMLVHQVPRGGTPQWKVVEGGARGGGGVLILPTRLLILALVNKLWKSSMEGMPVKTPSSKPIIDQNNHPGSWLCEISHPLVCRISRIYK